MLHTDSYFTLAWFLFNHFFSSPLFPPLPCSGIQSQLLAGGLQPSLSPAGARSGANPRSSSENTPARNPTSPPSGSLLGHPGEGSRLGDGGTQCGYHWSSPCLLHPPIPSHQGLPVWVPQHPCCAQATPFPHGESPGCRPQLSEAGGCDGSLFSRHPGTSQNDGGAHLQLATSVWAPAREEPTLGCQGRSWQRFQERGERVM